MIEMANAHRERVLVRRAGPNNAATISVEPAITIGFPVRPVTAPNPTTSPAYSPTSRTVSTV